MKSLKEKRLAHLKKIASLGGKAVAKKHGSEHMSKIGSNGGRRAWEALDEAPTKVLPEKHHNPGNFANDTQRAKSAGSKGGSAKGPRAL